MDNENDKSSEGSTSESSASESGASENSGALGERCERLLMRVADGQAHLIDRYRAAKLLSRNSAARSFLESVKLASAESAEALRETAGPDLWNKIAQRIDAEERAEVFIGKRVLTRTPGQRWYERVSLDRVAWGLTGGMMAASLTVFLLREPAELGGTLKSGTLPSVALPAGDLAFSAARVVPSVAPVSTVPVSSNASSLPFSRADRNIIEVDWMRSDGRVRMLQDPVERSAIIWIKRRAPGVEAAPRRQVAAVGAVTPLFPLQVQEQGR